MASSNDLIKYFTQEVVRYLDTPKEERKQKNKVPRMYHWFGFMPLAIRMTTVNTKKQLKQKAKKAYSLYKSIETKLKD